MKKNVRKSILFVPSLRIDMIEKAIKTDADSINIDLEDAVSLNLKDEGRCKCFEAINKLDFGSKEIIVRINPMNTINGLKDIVALKESMKKPDLIKLPKVENMEQIKFLSDILDEIDPEIGIIPVIESPLGLKNAVDIARASSKNCGLGFGGGDLSGELGCNLEWDNMLHSRNVVKVAAASAQIDCIDVPFLHLKDLNGLEKECKSSKKIGYNSKIAIHPNQIETINKVFYPSDDEIKWAVKIYDTIESNGNGVIVVDGKMIDAAIVKRATKIIQLIK